MAHPSDRDNKPIRERRHQPLARIAMSIRWLLPALLMVTPAKAHDWYPWDCCSGYDCAPVDYAELLPNADLLVTSRHGTTVVPASFPKRDSQDNRMHVCMRSGDGGSMRPICVFLPPAT
jgi:hypothetical protein